MTPTGSSPHRAFAIVHVVAVLAASLAAASHRPAVAQQAPEPQAVGIGNYYGPAFLPGQPRVLFAEWEDFSKEMMLRPFAPLPGQNQLPERYTYGWRWGSWLFASWWGWWELNSAPFITPLLRDQNLDEADDWRDHAADALFHASQSPDWVIREAAALALGRIGAEQYTDRLIELTADWHPPVRRAAFYALALLDDDEATDFLTKPRDYLHSFDAVALVSALGLLNSSDPRAIDILKKSLLQQTYADLSAQAMWALVRLNPPDLRDICWDVIRTTPWAMTAHHAILGLGRVQHPDDVKALTHFAVGVEDHADVVPSVPRPGSMLRDNLLGVVAEDVSRQPLTILLRLAAVHALADYSAPSPNVSFVISRVERLNRYGLEHTLLLDHLVALAAVGGADEAAFLAETARGTLATPSVPRTRPVAPMLPERIEDKENRKALTRSQAALALGLLLRKGTAYDPFFRDGRLNPSSLLGTLAAFATRPDADSDIRGASILGLGLANDNRMIPTLMEAAQNAAKTDKVSLGYALISMALLEDPAALTAAQNIFTDRADRLDLPRLRALSFGPGSLDAEQVFFRRAAFQALGILQDPAAESLLIAQWGSDFWTDIEIALALKRIGRFNIAEDLITLAESDNPVIQFTAVWSLGVLLEPGKETRLNRLIDGQLAWPMRSESTFDEARYPPGDPTRPRVIESELRSQVPYRMTPARTWRLYANPLFFGQPLQSGRIVD